jgi:hypothetical protein
MFSISSLEFPDFSTLVNKVASIPTEADAFESETTNIRSWCAERGFMFHISKTQGEVFYTIKYDRAKLTEEQYTTLGRFRSVVLNSCGHICCIAPPKMLKITDEMKALSVNLPDGVLTAEELVEGIMVNLFWSESAGKWYIATKSCVGEVSFDHIVEAQANDQVNASAEATAATTTAAAAVEENARIPFQKLSVQEVLRRRICEVLSLLSCGLATIPKHYCYSLVVQHPKNQIVLPITVPKLYLVAVYQLTPATDAVGVSAIRIDRDIFSANFGGSVSHMPSGLTCVADAADAAGADTSHTVEDYCQMYGSMDAKNASLPGVVFVDKDTGFCYKMRNPKYENVKKRKGMEQKLMAHYLQLRKDHGIDEYLKYHPQHSRIFRQFRDGLHDYTQRLYESYIAHYVKKVVKPLKEYDRELKTHMYKMHYDVYLATMKESGAGVTKHTVINYVNQLAVAQQFACLSATNAANAANAANTEAAGAGAGATTDRVSSAPEKHRSLFQKKTIERSKPGGERQPREDADTRSGFRSARNARGGRMVPALTIDPPKNNEEHKSLKGAKSTGSVKVHNQFAGLNVD